MNVEWSTPRDLFDELDDEFGFDLDVCAKEWNAKCSRYLDPEIDGLKQSWSGTCWMNPPYGREITHWIRKAYEESQKGSTVVCLVPSRTDTGWFHDFCLHAEIRWIRGRVWFCNEYGKVGRPRFGSAIVIFRPPKRLKRGGEMCGKQCRRPGEPFDTHRNTATVAHCNHDESDCSPGNLVCACAPCHLRYDVGHHAETRWKNKHRDQLRLF